MTTFKAISWILTTTIVACAAAFVGKLVIGEIDPSPRTASAIIEGPTTAAPGDIVVLNASTSVFDVIDWEVKSSGVSDKSTVKFNDDKTKISIPTPPGAHYEFILIAACGSGKHASISKIKWSLDITGYGPQPAPIPNPAPTPLPTPQPTPIPNPSPIPPLPVSVFNVTDKVAALVASMTAAERKELGDFVGGLAAQIAAGTSSHAQTVINAIGAEAKKFPNLPLAGFKAILMDVFNANSSDRLAYNHLTGGMVKPDQWALLLREIQAGFTKAA